MLYFLQRLF